MPSILGEALDIATTLSSGVSHFNREANKGTDELAKQGIERKKKLAEQGIEKGSTVFWLGCLFSFAFEGHP